MENSTHQHEHEHQKSDVLRNTIIFLVIFGVIATITYLEWAGRLH